MLCQFTFSNYRSYRDEATLTMQASSMREFSRSLLPGGGQPVLPARGGDLRTQRRRQVEPHRGARLRPVRRGAPHNSRSRAGRRGATTRRRACPGARPFAFDGTHGALPSEFEVYYRVSGYEYRYTLRGQLVRDRRRRAWPAARSAPPAPRGLFDREGGDVDLGPSLRRAGVSTGFNPRDPVPLVPVHEHRPRARPRRGELVPRLRGPRLQQLLPRAPARGPPRRGGLPGDHQVPQGGRRPRGRLPPSSVTGRAAGSACS